MKSLRKLMKMTNYGLLHNVVTEFVFFKKIVQLKTNMHSSTFNLASSMLNFLFEGIDFVVRC